MPSKKKYKCEICEKMFKTKQHFLTIFECYQHQFCQKCCLSMFNNAISVNSFGKQFLCPTCSLPFDTDTQFFKSKSPILKQRYIFNRFNKRQLKCPTDNCTAKIKLNGQQTLQCDQCKKKFCHVCFLPYHSLNKCQEYQVKQKILKDLNYRSCPKCLLIIEKYEGCDHMKCICGKQFCYSCNKDWIPSHLCTNPRHPLLRPQRRYYPDQFNRRFYERTIQQNRFKNLKRFVKIVVILFVIVLLMSYFYDTLVTPKNEEEKQANYYYQSYYCWDNIENSSLEQSPTLNNNISRAAQRVDYSNGNMSQ